MSFQTGCLVSLGHWVSTMELSMCQWWCRGLEEEKTDQMIKFNHSLNCEEKPFAQKHSFFMALFHFDWLQLSVLDCVSPEEINEHDHDHNCSALSGSFRVCSTGTRGTKHGMKANYVKGTNKVCYDATFFHYDKNKKCILKQFALCCDTFAVCLECLWDTTTLWLMSTCGELNWLNMIWKGTHLPI